MVAASHSLTDGARTDKVSARSMPILGSCDTKEEKLILLGR